MRYIPYVFLLSVWSWGGWFQAQDTLTLGDFMRQVKAYHPVAKVAALFPEQGAAQLQEARGLYDPYLQGKFDQKDYDGSRYWRTFDGGLNWQSPYAFSVQGGFETNSGVFLNPEQTLPNQGQAYLDVTVPLGKGLLMDAPRLAVRQAKIDQQDLEVARQQQLNDLLFMAGQRYWEWAGAHAYQQVADDARIQAELRFMGIRDRFLSGDAAGIDTVDAYVQWQSFEVDYLDAALMVQKSEQDLIAYNWTGQGQLLAIETTPFQLLVDSMITAENNQANISFLVNQHPEVQRYTYKLANLAAERRYKQESLKPKLDLSYRALSAKTAFTESANGEVDSWWNPNDYKFKASFGFPLFVREARGALAVNSVKQETAVLERNLKQAEITAKVSAAQAEVSNYFSQLTISQIMVRRYKALLAAEEEKFRLGESTLFVVNSRAQKLLSAQQKLISVRAKYEQALIKRAWAAGRLWQAY